MSSTTLISKHEAKQPWEEEEEEELVTPPTCKGLVKKGPAVVRTWVRGAVVWSDWLIG